MKKDKNKETDFQDEAMIPYLLESLFNICNTNSKRIDSLWEVVDILRKQIEELGQLER
jgi:hypothetical protein|tara:strand:+ start:90 stop:263 length:174 start_codon:yes stop_codon:yes gene_type:complete